MPWRTGAQTNPERYAILQLQLVRCGERYNEVSNISHVVLNYNSDTHCEARENGHVGCVAKEKEHQDVSQDPEPQWNPAVK